MSETDTGVNLRRMIGIEVNRSKRRSQSIREMHKVVTDHYATPLEERLKRVAVQELHLCLSQVANSKKKMDDELEELEMLTQMEEAGAGEWS